MRAELTDMSESMTVEVRGPSRFHELVAGAETLQGKGDTTGSLALLREAAALDAAPQDRYAVGEALLRGSQCAEGWDLYDLHPSRPIDRLAAVARWDGRPCQLLILVAEQGFGDAIQFLRFAPAAAKLAQRVVVAVHDELLTTVQTSPLLAGVTVIDKSSVRATHWPAYARWERLMSLPARIAGLKAEPVDAYLRVPKGRPESTLSPKASMVTIGVAWRSTVRRGFASRSFPARLVNVLTGVGGVRVVALHRNRDIGTLPPRLEPVTVDNFVDTAHIIGQCHYVVTADTVTAHLAPALGVPTFICLRNRPDWRWGTPAHPTQWYAAATTIFQDEARTWAPVVAEAAVQITEAIKTEHGKALP